MVRVLIAEGDAAQPHPAAGLSFHRRPDRGRRPLLRRTRPGRALGTEGLSCRPAVVLTTGGAGQIYARTTNPANATGDGVAMALRAGAVPQDMEFVQFHPTALYLPSSPPFRCQKRCGEELSCNSKGEVFMQRYHPLAASLPAISSHAPFGPRWPRPNRGMSIWTSRTWARNSSSGGFDDLLHRLRYDIDITEEWIPVSPSAHYMMGGVWTDLNGATTVPGLFAAGEVACTGVHGANRLASNSPLEGLVFGVRAAAAAIAYGGAHEIPSVTTHEAALKHEQYGSLDDAEKLRSSLRRTMWGQVGVIRSGESLIRACAQLALVAARRATVFSARSARGQKHGAGGAVCCGSGAVAGEQHRGPLPIGLSSNETAGMAAAQPAVDGGWNQRTAPRASWTSAGADGAGRVTGRSVITPSRTRKVR